MLILVNGIDTSARDIAEMAARWEPLTKQVSQFYSSVLYFSYNRNSATSYAKTDTYQSILFHHAPLLHDIIEKCYAQQVRSFDIVGYSLGGVVAMEYIKSYGFIDKNRIQHVVTLDSPVNGIQAKDLPFFLSGMFGSEAARELTTLAKGETTRFQNLQMSQSLEKRGTEVWTLTNKNDLFVNQDAALIRNLFRVFDLPIERRTFDGSQQLGHSQIMDLKTFPQVGETIYNILYRIPNSALVTELKEIPVLKPGEKGTAHIVIQNASIMPWPAGNTTLQHISGPTFGRDRVRPLPAIPASGQLELVIHVQAPSEPGVYDSALKIAINDITLGYEIPLSVVVVPASSSAGLTEQIRALIAQAREDLSKRFEETWQGLREQILAAIREEIARQVRAAIAEACGVTPTGVLIAGGVVWWRRRRRGARL